MKSQYFLFILCLAVVTGTFYAFDLAGNNPARELALLSDTSSLGSTTTTTYSSLSNTFNSTVSGSTSNSNTSSSSGDSSTSTSSGSDTSTGGTTSTDTSTSTPTSTTTNNTSTTNTTSDTSTAPTNTSTTTNTTYTPTTTIVSPTIIYPTTNTTTNTTTTPSTTTPTTTYPTNPAPTPTYTSPTLPSTNSASTTDASSSTLNTSPNSGPTTDTTLESTIKPPNNLETLEKVAALPDSDLLFIDSNEDGISDYDSVYIYNIDPVEPTPVSTHEGRTVNAGEKILLGLDPTTPEIVEIVPEEPSASAAPVAEIFKVEDVGLNTENKVVLRGTALPNSFVTIYVYSTPIIVTVRADEDGQWHYTMDQELENGEHRVYVATVNQSGKIVAKSDASLFTKTAEAATLSDSTPAQVPLTPDRPGLLSGISIFYLAVAVLGTIVIFILIIGLLTRKKEEGVPMPPAA